MMKQLILFFALFGAFISCNTNTAPTNVVCEGIYPLHLQGVDMNEKGEYFWSFTSTLVKTDADGKVLKTLTVADHHGDLVCWNDKLYVTAAIIHNYDKGAEKTYMRIYNQNDLSLVEEFILPGANGFDGITRTKNGFLIGAEPQPVLDATQSDLIEFDNDFNIIAHHTITTPPVYWGAQNLTQYGDGYLVAYYGNLVYKLDKDFAVEDIYQFPAAYGLIGNYNKGFAKAYHTIEERPKYAAALELVEWKQVPRYKEADKYITANKNQNK